MGIGSWSTSPEWEENPAPYTVLPWTRSMEVSHSHTLLSHKHPCAVNESPKLLCLYLALNVWNLSKCEENSLRFREMSQKSSSQYFTGTVTAHLITGLLNLECLKKKKKSCSSTDSSGWKLRRAVWLTLWMKMIRFSSSCCQKNIF